MNSDYRLNWQMPAQPLGPAICREEARHDPLREFETMTDAEPELPEGIFEGDAPGEYEAECVACERWTPIFCGLDEIPATGYRHYCGGGPRCCP